MSIPAHAQPPSLNPGKLHKWHRVVLRVCFILLAGELGFCLIVLPWMSNWDMSYIPVHNKNLADLWMSYYFRGVLTGLGLLNVYVALSETRRLLRSWLGKSG